MKASTDPASHEREEPPVGDVVSVIVPVHDVEAFVDACLQSIADQTHRRLDVVVVDDGSTDLSLDLCLAWASRDSRFRVTHTRAGGVSAARNLGLDRAVGDYVMFVDSDDVISPDSVATMLALARGSRADIAITSFAGFSEGAPRFSAGDSAPTVESARAALRRIVCDKPQWEVWAKLYRRSVWDGVRFPVGLVHQDLSATPRVFANARAVVSSDAVLYGYRTRSGSIMDLTRQRSLSTDLLAILDSNIELARVQSGSPEEFDAFAAAYLIHASKHLERLGGRSWSRNIEFRREYRAFARRHRRDIVRNGQVSPAYRALWLASSASPRLFRDASRFGRWARARGLSLRRGRG